MGEGESCSKGFEGVSHTWGPWGPGTNGTGMQFCLLCQLLLLLLLALPVCHVMSYHVLSCLSYPILSSCPVVSSQPAGLSATLYLHLHRYIDT